MRDIRGFAIVVLAVVLLGSRLSGEAAGIHWCGASTMSFTPTSGYQGDLEDYSFILDNGQSDALDISSFVVTYEWDANTWNLGAGTVGGFASITFTDSEYLPSTPGFYTVDVEVTGQAVGDFASGSCTYGPFTFEVRSLPPPPSVTVSANPTTGTAPLTVTFTMIVSNGLAPLTYEWTFGDGQTATGSVVTHTYQVAGSFVATVVVTDSRDRSDSATTPVTVSGGLLGGSALLLVLLLIVIVAVVAVVAVVAMRKKRPLVGMAPPPLPYQPYAPYPGAPGPYQPPPAQPPQQPPMPPTGPGPP